MASNKETPAVIQCVIALKVLDTAITGLAFFGLSMNEVLRFGPYWFLYTVLVASSIASLVLRWGSIVPCMITGVLLSEFFRPTQGNGRFEEAVAEALQFAFFPIAGLIVGIVAELLLMRFSHGWRRKAGIVVQAIAFVLTAFWVCSLACICLIAFNLRGKSILVLSTKGRIEVREDTFNKKWRASEFGWGVRPFHWWIDVVQNAEKHQKEMNDVFVSLGNPEKANFEKPYQTYATVPYWPIVLPATLLSAYLLLSKPRKSNQMKFTEPAPSEGS